MTVVLGEMAANISSLKFAARLCKVAARLCAALICSAVVLPSRCTAQERRRGGGLPRVGTIRDYPATGLTVGCGNIYSHLPRRPEARGDSYVFISNSDGGNAWMNLGGRDVRLRRIRRAARGGPEASRFEYRWGSLRVSVAFRGVKPGDPLYDEDFMFRLRITLRRGRAARTVSAVGHADC